MKKNILLTITIAALTLAACNDDASDNTAASAIPLQITAVVQNGTTTRTEVTGTNFGDGSSIGVTGVDRSNVQYTLNGTTWSSDTPIYYQDTSTKTFSAYYPYSDKVNSNGQLEDVDPDDYLFASGSTGSVDKNSVSFTFYHKMSKIDLTFAKGTGVTDDDFSSISKCHICGVYTKGTFKTTDGSTSTSGNIDVQEVTTTYDFQKGTLTGSTILYPQTAGEDGIYVVVKVNNVNYKTTLIAAGNSLASGNVYSYKVTINKTGLTVTLNSGITAWDDTTMSDETATKYDPTFTDINQVRLYDLVMEGGRFLHVDANADKVISDTECNQLGSYNLENVVGIVLWLGNPITDETKTVTDSEVPAKGSTYKATTRDMQIGDPILKSACSSCTHGLIAGIKYAEDATVKSAAYTYPWVWKRAISSSTGDYIYVDSDPIYSVSLNFQDIDGSGYGPSDNYLYIDGYDDENCKNENDTKRRATTVIKLNVWNNLSRFMGYNNTQVIKGYANTLSSKDYYFLTSCLENSYSQKISSDDGNNSFSDWFIPSMWELYVMFGGDETKSFRDYYITIDSKGNLTSLNDKINTVDLGLNTERIGYIKNITNALEDLGINSAFDPVSGIWTSTEFYCTKTTDSSPAIWFTCEFDEKSNIKSTHFGSATKHYASAAKHIVPVCAF